MIEAEHERFANLPYKDLPENRRMRLLYVIDTQLGRLKLVEGWFEVLHEIPLRYALLRAAEGMEAHWSIAALKEDGSRMLGEVDAVSFLREGKTWINIFEFKTSINMAEIVRQERRARFIASLVKLWLESRNINVVSWSYTVITRRDVDATLIAGLRKRGIGALTWQEVEDMGRHLFKRVLGRDINDIRLLYRMKGRGRSRRVKKLKGINSNII